MANLPMRVPLPTFRPDPGGGGFPSAPSAPAMPMQQAPMQAAAAQRGGGVRQWLGNNSEALAAMSQGLLSGRTGQEQFAQGFGGFIGARADSKKRTKTMAFLEQQDPMTAQAVELGLLTGPEAFKAIYDAKNKPTEYQQRALAAKEYGIDPNTPEGRAFVLTGKLAGADGGNEVYGTPIYGEDPNTGETVLGVIGKDSTFRALDTGGVRITPGTTWQDFGNYRQGFGKGGQAVTPQIPVGGSPSADQRPTQGGGLEPTPGSKLATDRALDDRTRSMEIAGAVQSAGNIDRLIQSIKSDPDLPRVLGPIDSRTPNISAGAVRVQAKIDQIGGQAFLEARQMLKGGGAITDFESNRAEQAFVRLNQAQSEQDFIAALDEFNAAVQSGVMKLQMQAGGQSGMQPQQAAPQQGNRRRYNPQTGQIE